MCDVLFGTRIFHIKIDGYEVSVRVVFQYILRRNLPCAFVFFSLLPPSHACSKFLELDGCGLGVILTAFRKRMFVIPNLLRWPRAIEEKQVRRNAGVGGEN